MDVLRLCFKVLHYTGINESCPAKILHHELFLMFTDFAQGYPANMEILLM